MYLREAWDAFGLGVVCTLASSCDAGKTVAMSTGGAHGQRCPSPCRRRELRLNSWSQRTVLDAALLTMNRKSWMQLSWGDVFLKIVLRPGTLDHKESTACNEICTDMAV